MTMFSNTSVQFPTPQTVTYDPVNRQLLAFDGKTTTVIGVNVLAPQVLTLTATHTTTFDQSGIYAVSATSNASTDEWFASIVYSIEPNVTNSAGATVNSGTGVVTLATVGVFTVLASSAATETFTAGTATQTITVNKGTQATLTLTSTSGTHGTPLTLTDSGGSGTGAVTFVVTSAGTAGATLTGGGTTVSAATAGTCTVTATKAADANWNTASSTATTVTFA